MARDISNFIRIAIPTGAYSQGLATAIVDVTKAAGGSTSWNSTGTWYDDEGSCFQEPIKIFQWNFASRDYASVDAAARLLVDKLFEAGEKAVMKERHYDMGVAEYARTVAGYACRILFAPTKH